jgi:hypothetical protein
VQGTVSVGRCLVSCCLQTGHGLVITYIIIRASRVRRVHLRCILRRAARAVWVGWAVDSVPAQHVVRDILDFGENALPRMVTAIQDECLLGFHR